MESEARNKTKLLVFGRKTANEVLEAAKLEANFDTFERIEFSDGCIDELGTNHRDSKYIVGIGDIALRRKVVAACMCSELQAATVVHQSAVLSPSTVMGCGCFVGPLAVFAASSFAGNHSIFHIHCSIGHDSRIGDFCTILPGARISGDARIGDRSLIGSNAFIAPGVSIGSDCRVDALSYVVQDLPDGYIVSPRSKSPLRRFI